MRGICDKRLLAGYVWDSGLDLSMPNDRVDHSAETTCCYDRIAAAKPGQGAALPSHTQALLILAVLCAIVVWNAGVAVSRFRRRTKDHRMSRAVYLAELHVLGRTIRSEKPNGLTAEIAHGVRRHNPTPGI